MITNVTSEFKNCSDGMEILLHYDEVGSDEDYYVVTFLEDGKRKSRQFIELTDIYRFLKEVKGYEVFSNLCKGR